MPALAPTTGGAERRAKRRRRSRHRPLVRLVIRPSFTNHRAFVLDVSDGGMGLLYKEALAPGTVLALLSPTMGTDTPWIVRLTVAHAAPHPGGGWLIGCELAASLDDDELRACLL